MSLEKMNEFFTARVDGYDEHMISNVVGCKEGYIKMADCIPANTQTLLDLGCGTGLELDEIFKRFPKMNVTGIDLTKAMLNKLKEKHGDKALNLIVGSYFDVDFGIKKYDCAVSFQTMHHFSHDKKTRLYKRIIKTLTDNGIYIECDYMVEKQEDEDLYFAENERLRKEENIDENEFYHYDTPCTIENQINMLKTAGFKIVEKIFRQENTTILVARREKTI